MHPTATAAGGTTWSATPKEPLSGHWRGYFIELYYPSDMARADLMVSTPGYVWPDTLPFEECRWAGKAPECPAWLV